MYMMILMTKTFCNTVGRKCMHKRILVGLAAQTRCTRPTYVKQTTRKSLNLPLAEDQCNTCEHLVTTPEAPVACTHLSMST